MDPLGNPLNRITALSDNGDGPVEEPKSKIKAIVLMLEKQLPQKELTGRKIGQIVHPDVAACNPTCINKITNSSTIGKVVKQEYQLYTDSAQGWIQKSENACQALLNKYSIDTQALPIIVTKLSEQLKVLQRFAINFANVKNVEQAEKELSAYYPEQATFNVLLKESNSDLALHAEAASKLATLNERYTDKILRKFKIGTNLRYEFDKLDKELKAAYTLAQIQAVFVKVNLLDATIEQRLLGSNLVLLPTNSILLFLMQLFGMCTNDALKLNCNAILAGTYTPQNTEYEIVNFKTLLHKNLDKLDRLDLDEHQKILYRKRLDLIFETIGNNPHIAEQLFNDMALRAKVIQHYPLNQSVPVIDQAADLANKLQQIWLKPKAWSSWEDIVEGASQRNYIAYSQLLKENRNSIFALSSDLPLCWAHVRETMLQRFAMQTIYIPQFNSIDINETTYVDYIEKQKMTDQAGQLLFTCKVILEALRDKIAAQCLIPLEQIISATPPLVEKLVSGHLIQVLEILNSNAFDTYLQALTQIVSTEYRKNLATINEQFLKPNAVELEQLNAIKATLGSKGVDTNVMIDDAMFTIMHRDLQSADLEQFPMVGIHLFVDIIELLDKLQIDIEQALKEQIDHIDRLEGWTKLAYFRPAPEITDPQMHKLMQIQAAQKAIKTLHNLIKIKMLRFSTDIGKTKVILEKLPSKEAIKEEKNRQTLIDGFMKRLNPSPPQAFPLTTISPAPSPLDPPLAPPLTSLLTLPQNPKRNALQTKNTQGLTLSEQIQQLNGNLQKNINRAKPVRVPVENNKDDPLAHFRQIVKEKIEAVKVLESDGKDDDGWDD